MEYYPNQGDRQLPPYYQSGEVPPEAIPPQYKPLSPWAYLGYQILFTIPLVGLIALIIFALNNDNINRRNFARSSFLLLFLFYRLRLQAAAGRSRKTKRERTLICTSKSV